MTFFTSQNELKTPGINKVFTAVLPKKMPEIFSPRPTLRSGLGKLKNSSSGGGAQKNDYFFHFFQSLDFVFFLFYCRCTMPIPTISQGYSSYRLCHFHTYMGPFWMDTGLFSNRFLTFRSKSCTKKCFKPRQRLLKFKETCRFPIAASSKQSTPSKSLS